MGEVIVITSGKGGVGKTTIAAAIAMGLSQRGKKVHLATTDPAAHLNFVLNEADGITMSHIDEAVELKKYLPHPRFPAHTPESPLPSGPLLCPEESV